MKTVYICSAYRGDIENNIKKAQEYCRVACSFGLAPIVPHLYLPQVLDDTNKEQRRMALKICCELVKKCDEVWACGKVTEGMQFEIDTAKKYNIPIKYIFEEGNNEQ